MDKIRQVYLVSDKYIWFYKSELLLSVIKATFEIEHVEKYKKS